MTLQLQTDPLPKRGLFTSIYTVVVTIMIGLTERKIGLHDLLGKTRVLEYRRTPVRV
jgi:hypothetical protein